MGLELAEQLGWQVPDVDPLSDRRRHRPDRHVEGVRRARGDRLHRRQAAADGGGAGGGLRPDRAGVRGRRRARARAGRTPTPIAAGIRVPQAVGDFLILRAVRESSGFAIAVDDDAITAGARRGGARGRLPDVPGRRRHLRRLQAGLADGRIRRDERAVLFNCATGLKYPLPPVHRTLDRTKPIDFAAL